MIKSHNPRKSRMILRLLKRQSKISQEKYEQLMGLNLRVSQPFLTIDLYFRVLAVILIIAGIICLTAFNWLQLSPFIKLSIVELALIISFIATIITKNALHKNISAAFFAVLIGCFWAVFGQIYQINSSFYHYTLIWGLSILPFALVLRQQFLTALTTLLLYITWFLYAELSHFLSYNHLLTWNAVITSGLTILFVIFQRYKYPSFNSGLISLFAIIMMFSIFIYHMDLLLRTSQLMSMFLLVLFLGVGIFIFMHLQKKAIMLALYLYSIFALLSITIFLNDSFDFSSYTFFITICGIIAVFPTYKGALLLMKLYHQVNHHE